MKTALKPIVVACSSFLVFSAPLSVAAATDNAGSEQTQSGNQAGNVSSEASRDAMQQIDEAAQVLRDAQSSQEFTRLLEDAEGIFVIPDYATAALLIGGKGGEGVVLTRKADGWSNPAFYEIGGLSVGAQAGAEAGALVMVLMSENAIETFQQSNNFSLNANVGLSIINWSADAQASVGKGEDVVIWTDLAGAMLEASIGVSDIMWDEDENQAYYQTSTSPQAVLTGQVTNPREDQLQQILSSGPQAGHQTAGMQDQDRQSQETAATIEENYDQLDKDGDGKISESELNDLEATAAGPEGRPAQGQIMKQLDQDGDNELSREELENGTMGTKTMNE